MISRNLHNQFYFVKNLLSLSITKKSQFYYLYDSLEGLVALLVRPGLLQVPPDAHVLAQEHLAVVLQPVKHLKRKPRLTEEYFDLID